MEFASSEYSGIASRIRKDLLILIKCNPTPYTLFLVAVANVMIKMDRITKYTLLCRLLVDPASIEGSGQVSVLGGMLMDVV